MMTLLGSLLGFISSTFPELMKMLRDLQDKKHEIKILELQLEQLRVTAMQKIEEIFVPQQADMQENLALYKTYNTGVGWVDAFNGTVRPVIAYAFFILYAGVKLMSWYAFSNASTSSLSIIYDTLWTQEDAAIFAGIISFYFGQRAMGKVRKGA